MGKYDFDTVIDRRNTASLKWDVQEGELPMWVADMDFMVAPEIQKALKERLNHPIYAYTYPTKDWYDSYIRFYRDRHHLDIEKDWLVFSLGVVPTISSSVRKLTNEGDHVVITTPVYNIFFNSIINNHRIPLEVPLILKDGDYYFDFDALEKAFAREDVSLFILCNPQNPVSRIWTKEELDKIGRLAKKYHVLVLSDEIHCELVRPGMEYVPFISANEVNREICVMAISVTKSFNLAGIQTSAIVITNPELRKKVVRQINTDEVAEPNILSCPAAVSSLNFGREWLDELRNVIFENRKIVEDYIGAHIPSLCAIKGDATYLVWIDASNLCPDASVFTSFLRKHTGLYVSAGGVYGKGGEGFFRLNVACPKKTLMDGLERLEKGTQLFLKEKKGI